MPEPKDQSQLHNLKIQIKLYHCLEIFASAKATFVLFQHKICTTITCPYICKVLASDVHFQSSKT
jgi:hypothetical protein